ncbi:Serine/threonine-protein kinase, partial [Rhizophlyctis rosea]
MGNIVSPATPRTTPAGIDSYVSELSELQYEKSLGSARFMKTIKCKHLEGPVVVKIFIKPEPNLSLRRYVKGLQGTLHCTMVYMFTPSRHDEQSDFWMALEAERNILAEIPNAFPYQRVFETDKAGYMVRQYFANNLYDRISTRPFLDQIEKKWIAYQILAGLAEAHAHRIYHGDIKTENVLVTSWNWTYLCDFSHFKPAFLPEDNPADFSFFFDTSSRRVCYLAPERFYAPGETLFGGGEGGLTDKMDVFSLGCTIAELFLEGTPLFSFSQLLRYRSGEYDPSVELEKIEDRGIKDLVKHMIQIDPSARFTADQYLSKWRGTAFPEYFYTFLHPYISSMTDGTSTHSSALFQVWNATTSTMILADADRKVERIWSDFGKIVAALGIPGAKMTEEGDGEEVVRGIGLLPVNLCVPNYTISSVKLKRAADIGDRCLLFTTVICSSIRNCVYPSSKLMALDLLLAFGIHLDDVYRLERIVPYLVAVLPDESPLVRASALKVLAQLVCSVETITTADANIFSEYLLPNLKKFSSDSEGFVRATYAACVAGFAEAALKFLELSQLLKNEHPSELESDVNLYQMTYDTSLRDLQESIQEEVIQLLIDPDPLVKRALLGEMSRLCIFFGRQRANDVLLSHMITYLNDLDWGLRCSFFESIVGVGTFVGGRSLEEYILPLMVQALTDSEEFVVEKVLNSLTSLAELGLLQKYKLKQLASTIVPLCAITFLTSTARLLPQIDVRCILYPIIKPFLKMDITEITDVGLLEGLKSPVGRGIWDSAVGIVGRGGESAEFLGRLKEVGMTEEDREKLVGMKYFISKFGMSKMRKTSDVQNQWAWPDDIEGKAGFVPLKNFGITPHTVFLTPRTPAEEPLRADPSARTPTRSASESSIAKLGPPLPSPTTRPLIQHRRGPSDSITIQTGNAATPQMVRSQTTEFGVRPRTNPGRSRNTGAKSPLSMEIREEGLEREFSSAKGSGGGLGVSGGLGARPLSAVSALSDASSSREYERLGLVPEVTSVEGRRGHRRTDSSASVLEGSARGGRGVGISFGVGGLGEGREKFIQRLLEKKTAEAFPTPLTELGSKVTPPTLSSIPNQQRSRRNRGTGPAGSGGQVGGEDLKGWRPEGTMVAHLTEHKGAVNALRISPDCVFFATGGEDGSVRVWDSARLEKNVTSRSRAVYEGHGGKVKALAFCEGTHSIASAADNGSIHICRVEYMKTATSSRYGGYFPVKKADLGDDQVQVMEHFEAEMQNILVYATARGRLCGLDLRSMQEAWSFDSPPHYGSITALTIDPHRQSWVTTGTSRGVMSLWDIRFGLRVKAWGHPSRGRIHKMSPFWGRKGGTGIGVAVEGRTNEVGLWDVEEG